MLFNYLIVFEFVHYWVLYYRKYNGNFNNLIFSYYPKSTLTVGLVYSSVCLIITIITRFSDDKNVVANSDGTLSLISLYV